MAAELSAALNIPEPERLEAELVLRHWAIDRVEQWLGEEDSRIFLVTGPPGTGKTSLVAQLVMLREGVIANAGHPRLSSATLALAHFCDASNERTLDPLEFVGALSDGLANHVPGFAQALASSASATSVVVSVNSSQSIESVQPGASVTNVKISVPRDVPTRQAFAYLVRRPLEAAIAEGWNGQLLVLVDDLSGGYRYDSEDNIARLIGVVADNPKELPGCLRFVVTSRPDPWVVRDLPAPSLDLLADQPTGQDDIRRYADRRLSSLNQPLRHAWTENVTLVAEGNFLYARHVLDHLLADEAALAGGPANYELPTSLLDLYRTWFKGGIARHKDLWWNCFQPVLTALTVARGAGLTLAQLVGITGLTASKVRRALDESSQYLLGTLPKGPVRLYHDSFREFLAAEEVSVEEGDRAVVDYFVQRHADCWLRADDYACDHLVTHAAGVGELLELLRRPDFLVVTEPTALLHQLSRLGEEDDGGTEVYRRIGWLLAGCDHAERASYLELAAHEVGDARLASQFAQLPLRRGWEPRWASLLRHCPSRVVGSHPDGVLDMLPVELSDGGTIVATVSNAGELRLWELRSHTLIETVKLDPPYPTAHLALVPTANTALLAVASPRTVWLVDLHRAEVVSSLTGREDALITGVTAAFAGEDRLVLVLGYEDGWLDAVDPDSGGSIGSPVRAHEGPVVSLEANYTDAVMSGGVNGMAVIHYLDANGFVEPGAIMEGASSWAGACAFLENRGDWVLCAGHSDGVVDWVQHMAGRQQQHTAQAHQPASRRCGYYAVSSDGSYSTVEHRNFGFNTYEEILEHHRQRDVERHERQQRETPTSSGEVVPAVSSIVRVSGGVNSVDLFVLDGRVLLASGGEDGEVHVFDLGADPPVWDNAMPAGQPVATVRFAQVDGRAVLLAAESVEPGTIRELPLRPGPSALPPLVGEVDTPILYFAQARDADGRNLIALASADGSLVLRDMKSGKLVADPLDGTGLLLNGLHLSRWDDELIAVAFGRDLSREDGTSSGAVRLWRLRSGICVASHEARFEALEDVTAAVSVGKVGEVVVAGTSHGEESDELWLLTEQDGHWRSAPLRSMAEEGAFTEDLIEPEAIAAAPGADDRIVLIKEFGGLYVLSLDDLTLTEQPVFADVVDAVRYRRRTAMLVGEGSSVRIRPIDVGVNEDDLFFDAGDGEVAAVAALDEAKVVVAGMTDGRLLVWRSAGAPAHVIQLGSTPRQVAICDDAAVVVRTDLGLVCLSIEPNG